MKGRENQTEKEDLAMGIGGIKRKTRVRDGEGRKGKAEIDVVM